MLFSLLLACFPLYLLYAQECSDVYPHLSCGLAYDDENSCLSAGCCWDPNEEATNNCFAPKINGYSVNIQLEETGRTYAELDLIEPSGIFSGDIQALNLSITQETVDRTHIKISSPGRWEVPDNILPRPGGVYTGDEALTKYLFTNAPDDPMELVISRTDSGQEITGELIFIFSKMLVFQDQYLEFVLGIPEGTVATYGFGESTRKTQRLEVNTTYTLWNTDSPAAGFNNSLYGTHPFFIQVMPDGKAHGVLFMNSNAMDVSLADSSTLGGSIGIQSTGGVVDIYVFAGPTPAEVISQYLEVVGMPAMVPYWSLGFHNCRWGYPDIGYVEDVVANYSAAAIPLETQWVDIDYMDAYLDFTLDPIKFSEANMTAFVTSLHNNNQRFVPIVDPGIYVRDPSYTTFTEGMEQNVFVMDMTGSTPYLGQVWPGPTYFPDWFAENTTSWWTDQMSLFRDLVAYDGIWIDMNEVANFCNMDGQAQVCVLNASDPCPDNSCCLICSTPDPDNTYDFPPFVPHVAMGTLGGKTMSMNSYHAGGVLEYDAHSLYGFMESIATREALLGVTGKRPFVLSRSTFLGSGAYTAHWTGDNAATWDDLSASIITMNNMALFGIPMIGADICGFFDDTTEELCTRWIEVGAFSPFSRDHNDLDSAPQELYRWDTVAEASRTVLNLRYQLLPYLYTLMYNAHNSGEMVHNAMWVHFPEDSTTSTRDGQYMWNDGILFTPVLVEGATSVTGYFPKSKWYSMFDASMIDASAGGKMVELDTPLTATNVHVRGGTVVPMQGSAMTTTEARETPFSLLIALDEKGMADGSLFLDDGEQVSLSEYSRVVYSVSTDDQSSSTLSSTAVQRTYNSTAPLGSIEIRGVMADYVAALQAETCDASVVFTDSVEPVVETAVTVGDDYSTLMITLSTSDNAASVVSDFVVSWQCTGLKTQSNDDDESGWSALPSYAQGLIIAASVVFGVLLIGGGGYYIYLSKGKDSSNMERSLL